MNEVNLKDLLNKINISKGKAEEANNESLYERFEDRSKVVWQSEPDRHRWYTTYEVVRKISFEGHDYYFQDVMWDVHGEEASAEDCGWVCPDVSNMLQVFPKEVKTIIYVPKEE